MQRVDHPGTQEELERLRKLVKEQEATISALRQEVEGYRQGEKYIRQVEINAHQAEMNAHHAALAARNDAQRLERTKNSMTRYGRRY